MRLSPAPAEQPAAEADHGPVINTEAIHDFVKQVEYPIGFLDFETIMPGVPMFDHNRPYQQLVFQYSLHTQSTAASPVIHTEHLAEATGDPRLQIIQNLIKNTEDLQTVFVYNITFERSRLYEMADDFPEFAEALHDLAFKLLDLMPVFRTWYRTAAMGSSYSIKIVLPALCHDLNYDDLPIGDGATASNAFLHLYHETDDEKRRDIRNQLIRYCTQDTYAMVRLWEEIKRL